jgi:hypothetical protein
MPTARQLHVSGAELSCESTIDPPLGTGIMRGSNDMALLRYVICDEVRPLWESRNRAASVAVSSDQAVSRTRQASA